MKQADIIAHYRYLRGISTRHHHDALVRVAGASLLDHAKHLGLANRRALVAESDEEMTLVFDLAVHMAKPGRSRAIDRYAKALSLLPGSDEAKVLDAIRDAEFSLWQIASHHEIAGLVVKDILRGKETWLVDEALTQNAQLGLTFASRLFWPAAFAMTCGVVVPVDAELLESTLLDSAGLSHHPGPTQLANDPRFAAAIYRKAINAGTMDGVIFR